MADAAPKVLTVCLSPTLQKTCVLEGLVEDEVNRCTSVRLDASGKGINCTRYTFSFLLRVTVEIVFDMGGKAVDMK